MSKRISNCYIPFPQELTVIRHGENRDLRDRPVAAFDSSSSLVDSRQVRVHVTWITAPARDFFSCR